MKKILIVLMVLLLPTFSWAASSKVVNMTEDTAPASDSLVYTVDDPAGTAVDRKVTIGNVLKGVADGTNTAPSVAFADDQDTGTYSPAADSQSRTVGGVEADRVTETARTIESNATVCATDAGVLHISTTAVHALAVDDVVQFAAGTGALCTGITAATNYYVTAVDSTKLVNIAATRGGTPINWTDNGTAFTSSELEITANVYGTLTITGAGALRGSYGGGGITTNFAAGNGALQANTIGSTNTSSGLNSLYSNTTGNSNTSSGFYALYSNTTGSNNTASGVYALYANNANSNTASGMYALYANSTGNSNTASGLYALYSNTTGSNNTALGHEAGRYIADGSTDRTTGNNGLYLGYNSKASADGTDNEIVIGYNAIGNGSNTVTLGNTSITKTFLNGHPVSVGADPVLSTCGTTPAIVGSDMAGKVTIGTGATTSCTATFATAYANAPACTIAGDNAAVGYAATTSTTVLTITSSADMASDVISYICIGL